MPIKILNKSYFGSNRDANTTRRSIPNLIISNLGSLQNIDLDYYRILSNFCSDLDYNISCLEEEDYSFDDLLTLIDNLDDIYTKYHFSSSPKDDISKGRLFDTVNLIADNIQSIIEYRQVYRALRINIDTPYPSLSIKISSPDISPSPQNINIGTYIPGKSLKRDKIIKEYLEAVLSEAASTSNRSHFLLNTLAIKDYILPIAKQIHVDLKKCFDAFKKNRPNAYNAKEYSELGCWNAVKTRTENLYYKDPAALLDTIEQLFYFVQEYKRILDFWKIKMDTKKDTDTTFPDFPPRVKPEVTDDKNWILLQSNLTNLKLKLKTTGLEDVNLWADVALYMCIFIYEKERRYVTIDIPTDSDDFIEQLINEPVTNDD